jgi:hypothetical protein
MHSRFRGLEIVDDQVASILAQKSPEERIAMADRFWRSARKLVEAMLSREHPDWPDDEIQREVTRRMLGQEVHHD